jgi:hypothetical protein
MALQETLLQSDCKVIHIAEQTKLFPTFSFECCNTRYNNVIKNKCFVGEREASDKVCIKQLTSASTVLRHLLSHS